jgi:hypothetical protein
MTDDEKLARLIQRVDRMQIELDALGCIARSLVRTPEETADARALAEMIFVGDNRDLVKRQLDGVLDDLGFPLPK